MTLYYTNSLFWKREKPFLTTNEDELIERVSNGLETYEVLSDDDFKDDYKYKMYLDIDYKLKNPEEFDEDKCEMIEMYGGEYIEMCVKALMPDFEPKISTATSHSQKYIEFKTKKETSKISVRYWITNLRATKNQQKLFVNKLNKIAYSEDGIWKYMEKTPDLFDKGIYDTNRKMRCVGTSKPNENRPLVLKHGEIKDTIISGCFADDITDFVELPEPKSKTTKKEIKPKKETKPKKSKEEDEAETDDETQTTVSHTSSRDTEKINEDCEKIRQIFEAILVADPHYFDKYEMWSQLGYLIHNQTNGSDEGCDLFLELSNLRETPQEVSSNTASK